MHISLFVSPILCEGAITKAAIAGGLSVDVVEGN